MPVARIQALVENGHPTKLWRIRSKQRALDKGPTRRAAEFESARKQLTTRLSKLHSIADRLPRIVMSIQTEKQLRELIWYLSPLQDHTRIIDFTFRFRWRIDPLDIGGSMGTVPRQESVRRA
jgi:hypothetical protein